jgi:hypothetical protein
MIHSRPGFASRSSDAAPAKLNDDMVPALHRDKKETSTPLKQSLQSRADQAFEKLKADREALALAEAQAIASKLGPELLINPAPTEPPRVLEPGK